MADEKQQSKDGVRRRSQEELDKALYDAIRDARKKQAFQRQTMDRMVKQFVGANYSADGADDKVPLDMLALATSVIRRHLVSDMPAVFLSTRDPELVPDAYTFELATNHILQKMRFGFETRKCVTSAIFSVGFMMTALEQSKVFEREGRNYVYGRPFCSNVSLQNRFHDPYVGDLRDATFEGHLFRLPYDAVMDSDSFKHKGKLKPNRRSELDKSLQKEGEKEKFDDEYVDFVELMAVLLPLEGRYITIPTDEAQYGGKPLNELEWNDESPYYMLGLIDVPDQVFPLSPMQNLVDLHDLANRLFTKLGRQAHKERTILAYQSSAQAEAEEIREAPDQSLVRVDHIDALKEMKLGGVSRETLAFLLHIYERFSYMAGNLDSIGGLGSNADTLGQEELMASSASRMISEYQDLVYVWLKAVTTRIARYVWDDPIGTVKIAKRVPGTDIIVPETFGPMSKRGTWDDYSIDVLPCASQRHTPTSRLKAIQGFLLEVVQPLMPVLQAQGHQINFEAICRYFERYADLPELAEIVTLAGGEGMEAPQLSDSAPKPSVTNRTYTRRNEGSGRPISANRELMNSLLSAPTGR